ncbi:MAG: type II secretion system F family protein [Acholeplasmataceae bacterium]|nr:type II secretion system F family protein [Acholeplasmataceae bacterium]
MPIFDYQASSLDGTITSDSMIALDERDLKMLLKRKGLYLVDCKEHKDKKPNTFFALSSKVSTNDVITFMRQLAVMINAGVQIEDSINTLKNQESAPAFKTILISVHNDILEGVYLSEAFGKFPKIFPAFFKNMILIGELSGSLDLVLNKLADYYERDRKIRGKAKSAMIYPTFLFLMIVTVFIFLTVFIVPQFESMLNEVGGEMPFITVMILNISDFVTLYFPFIITGIILFVVLLILFFRTKKGRYIKDGLKLKLPFLKPISHYLITARFARGFGVLVASGMSIMDSIETIGRLMENKVFEKRFVYAIDEVKRGKRIAKSIKKLNFFPPMMTEMIGVGEKTGSLDEVLETTAVYYDEKLEQAIEKATAAMEPLLIVIAGGMVGTVILSIFLPIISIMGSIG